MYKQFTIEGINYLVTDEIPPTKKIHTTDVWVHNGIVEKNRHNTHNTLDDDILNEVKNYLIRELIIEHGTLAQDVLDMMKRLEEMEKRKEAIMEEMMKTYDMLK